MVKKIIVVEVIEHVYTPDLNDDSGIYVENDITTIEAALEFDKKDVEANVTTLTDLADESKSVSKTWRIIEEP